MDRRLLGSEGARKPRHSVEQRSGRSRERCRSRAAVEHDIVVTPRHSLGSVAQLRWLALVEGEIVSEAGRHTASQPRVGV